LLSFYFIFVLWNNNSLIISILSQSKKQTIMKKSITLSLLFLWGTCLMAKTHASSFNHSTPSPKESMTVIDPDLTVEMISAQNNNYSQGTYSEITVYWRVKTTQDLPNTAQVKFDIRISPDANPANGQLILSIIYSGSEIKAAQPREDNRTFTNPTGSPAFQSLIGNVLNGINYAFVTIDVDNQIVEPNENNNMSNLIAFDYRRIDCFSRGIEPWQEWISRVQFNTIDNASLKTRYGFGIYIADGYSYFKDIKTTVQQGQTYPLSITPSLSWSGRNSNLHYRAWIDFNGNGVFDDAGETILQQNAGNNTATQNVTIPTNARLGTFTMRVSMKGGSYPTPCEIFQFGEVEDYTVEIKEGTPTNGRDTLHLLGVSGANTVRQGGQITLNVTIKNTGTSASSPTTPLSIYQNQQPWAFRGPQPTYYTLVSNKQPINRAIQPNETVTVPVTFTLNTNFTHKSPLAYPPIVFDGTQVTIGERASAYSIPLYNQPSIDTLFYFYNMTAQLDATDISIEMTTADPTYGADGRYAYQLTVKNRGTMKAKNVAVQVTEGLSATFQLPLVTVSKGSVSTSFFVGTYYPIWSIGDLAAGEQVTAFAQFVDPSLASLNTVERRAKVYSNQIEDTNTANDSDSKTFTFRSVSGVYCIAKGTFPWEQWIDHVWVSTGIGSTSFPATFKDGYGNFTNTTAATVQRGQACLIGISPKSSWGADPRNANMYWRVWIDLNNDNDFDDAGEMVISRQVTIYLGTFLDNEQAFVVPATASLGRTRLRIAMKVGGYPTPCETFERGEVEDYAINIVNPATTAQQLMTFGDLKTRIVETTIRLDWVRLSDKVIGFDIEKSNEGESFKFMKKVAVSSYESYYFAYDEQPTEGGNFYRLKMTLNDDKVQYSSVQHVDYQTLADFTVFPNPTSNDVFIDLKMFTSKAIHISVSNIMGHIVLNDKIAAANRSPHRLDISGLESGLYYIRVETVGKRAVVRKLQVMK
jgi:GEVED domain/Domain of unknown function DUF11/Secretion system C-terminal sorting domain